MNTDYIICILLVIIIIVLVLDKMNKNKNKEPFLDKLWMSVDKNKGAVCMWIHVNIKQIGTLYYWIDKKTNKLIRITSSDFNMYVNAVASNDLHIPHYVIMLDWSNKPNKVNAKGFTIQRRNLVLNRNITQESVSNLIKDNVYDELSQNVLRYDTDGELPIIYIDLDIRTDKNPDYKTLIEYINNTMESFQFQINQPYDDEALINYVNNTK